MIRKTIFAVATVAAIGAAALVPTEASAGGGGKGGGIGFDDRKGTLDRHWIVLQGGNAGEPIAAAYSDRAVAGQGVTKALAIERGLPAHAKRQTSGDAAAPMGRKTPASRKLIRGPSFCPTTWRSFLSRRH